MPFTITIPVDQQRVADLITSAIEGGSNYWLDRVEPKFAIHEAYSEGVSYGDDMIDRVVYAEDDDTAYLFGKEAIQQGLDLLGDVAGGRHLADFLVESDDAETGDVFFQLCLFGEVVYG